MRGRVGESCPECGNFTMVRNDLPEVRHLRRDDGVQLRITLDQLRPRLT
jgi:hypothetical protein